MQSRLWYMNADFEVELAAGSAPYRRLPKYETLNRRLSERLLWLAAPGDVLIVEQPIGPTLVGEAARRGVELIPKKNTSDQQHKIFTPWGWTRSAVELGRWFGAQVEHPDLEVISNVNSKLWSFALEQQLGIAIPGSGIASGIEELAELILESCPGAGDKWVIKSPFGFAARDRVLGRGPRMDYPQAEWVRRQFTEGRQLLFQPWLDVKREYGIVIEIGRRGEIAVQGVSDLQTNGAGTGKGYLLGRKVDLERLSDLEEIASVVGRRLFQEGYYGPAGIDALEHAGGLLPLLEVNARYTMGFVALAVERQMLPTEPIFWSTK
jgi:hypothetical protein